MPARVQAELARLVELNPWGNPDSYVFFSTMPDKPIEAKIITRELYRALRTIGISEGERVRRNLTFHSWRHLFNSILVNARVPSEKIRSVTGHVTPEMTAHYFKLSADGYEDIRAIQAGLFDDDGPETFN
jgi:integrase